VAKANFYPSLTISAARGIAETNLTDLFNAPAIVWNIFGGIAQPIFSNGLNRQRLIAARADQAEALASFQKTLLLAGGEVVNGGESFNSTAQQRQ